MLRDKGIDLSAVIELKVDDKELVRRVSGRYSCAQCGAVYHDSDRKPAADGVCDKCGSTHFKRRPDDNAETMKQRLEVYYKETSPLRSDEHTSELQSLMRSSYAVFCLTKKSTNASTGYPYNQH